MVKGMITAMSAVSYALGFLVVITYVFAIALTQLAGDTEFGGTYFPCVSLSMYSLIVHALYLDDGAPFADEVKAESTECFGICVVYVGVASMTIMNLLVGILVEVVASVAQEERERLTAEKVDLTFDGILGKYDSDQNGEISWVEFQQVVQREDDLFLKALHKFDVDPEVLLEVAQSVFSEKEVALTLDEFKDLILDLRGNKQVSIKDVMMVSKMANRKLQMLNEMIDSIEDKLKKVAKRVHRKRFNGSSIGSCRELLRGATGSSLQSNAEELS